MSAFDWIALAGVGGLGAVARFRLDAAVESRLTGEFPAGTFAVNISGSLTLGILTGLGVTGALLFVLGTGFLGSYTTFSTWIFETQRLEEDGETTFAVWNLVASTAAGLLAAGAGWGLGALL